MIVVSLTSTSNRLDILRFTLQSLLEQDLKADRIVLNISKEAYLLDDGIQELPNTIKTLEQSGIEVNWVENTGPYRKLLPVLYNASDDDIIVTCDDDVIYGKEWLKSLIESAQKNPDKIVCGRARQTSFNFLRIEKSYSFWPLVEEGKFGLDLIPIGIAGVVYRKSLLNLDFIFNDGSKIIAPKQDDLWFKKASQIKNIPVLVAPGANYQVYPIESAINLYSSNTSFSKDNSNKPLLNFLIKVLARIKGYFGVPVYGNDFVWKEVTKFIEHSIANDYLGK